MKIHMTTDSNSMAKILEIEGALEIFNSYQLKDKLEELVKNGNSLIILNLKKVNYIDSSGIGVILRVDKMLQEKKSRLMLTNLSNEIKELFKLTKIDLVLKIYENRQDAIKSLYRK